MKLLNVLSVLVPGGLMVLGATTDHVPSVLFGGFVLLFVVLSEIRDSIQKGEDR